jgi:hypothetical protein
VTRVGANRQEKRDEAENRWLSFSLRGRVPADDAEGAPQVDDALAVQLQLLDCGAPGRRQSDDERKLVAPREVLAPAVPAWMIQRHPVSGNRIDGVDADILAVISALA